MENRQDAQKIATRIIVRRNELDWLADPPPQYSEQHSRNRISDETDAPAKAIPYKTCSDEELSDEEFCKKWGITEELPGCRCVLFDYSGKDV